MDNFNEYMEEFKTYSLEKKKKTALEQLKVIASLTNEMCNELGFNNELLITKDILEAHENINSEEKFTEGVVIYASSIQNSLCDFINKFTEVMEKKTGE